MSRALDLKLPKKSNASNKRDPVSTMHVYLYSVRGGCVAEDKGEVCIRAGVSRGVFQSDDTHRRIYCAPNPGEVYNGTVWFHLVCSHGIAMTKLAEYERDRIFELSKQLRSHEQKLSLILGSSCRKG